MPMRCAKPITRTRFTISSNRSRPMRRGCIRSSGAGTREAIGAMAMKGVADNLAAGLEQRLTQRGLTKAREGRCSHRRCARSDGARKTGPAPRRGVDEYAVDLWRPSSRKMPARVSRKARRYAQEPGRLRETHAYHPSRSQLSDEFDADEASDDKRRGENSENQEQDGEEQDSSSESNRVKPT